MQRPVEPGGHLLDVRRLAGAVVALDHHAPVVLEAGEDGERHLPVEHVVVVDVGHVVVGLGVGGHLEVGIDAEQLAHGHFHVGQAGTPRLGLGLAYRFGFRMFCPVLGNSTPHRIGYSLELGWQASDQSSLLEIVISLDDFAQLVLGPFVPPLASGWWRLTSSLKRALISSRPRRRSN